MAEVIIYHKNGTLECKPFMVNRIDDIVVDPDLPLPETSVSE